MAIKRDSRGRFAGGGGTRVTSRAKFKSPKGAAPGVFIGKNGKTVTAAIQNKVSSHRVTSSGWRVYSPSNR